MGVLSDLSLDFGDLLRASLEVGDLLLDDFDGDLPLEDFVGDLLLEDFAGDLLLDAFCPFEDLSLDDLVVFDDLSLELFDDLSFDDLAFFDVFAALSLLDFLDFSLSSDFVFLVLAGCVSGFDFRLWLLVAVSAWSTTIEFRSLGMERERARLVFVAAVKDGLLRLRLRRFGDSLEGVRGRARPLETFRGRLRSL